MTMRILIKKTDGRYTYSEYHSHVIEIKPGQNGLTFESHCIMESIKASLTSQYGPGVQLLTAHIEERFRPGTCWYEDAPTLSNGLRTRLFVKTEEMLEAIGFVVLKYDATVERR